MKILVTGGTGFLGTHLVKKIRALIPFVDNLEVRTASKRQLIRYDSIKAVSNEEKERVVSASADDRGHFFYNAVGKDETGYYQPGHKHFSIDLTKIEIVRKMFDYYEPDVIIHLAGNPLVKNPEGIFRDNVEVTQNLLTHCPQDCRFIFASSIVVYGDCQVHPKCTEKDLPRPTSEYGITKLTSEYLVNMFTNRNKVIGVNLRLCATVGDGLTHGVIFDFMRKIREDETLTLLGDSPGSTKPYLHVDDAVKAFMKFLIHKPLVTGTFNVVPDDEINIEELAFSVIKGMNVIMPIEWLGEEANWAGDNRYLCASSGRLRSLGWTPKYTSSDAVVKAVKDLQ